jgi:hypothetical protein
MLLARAFLLLHRATDPASLTELFAAARMHLFAQAQRVEQMVMPQ